MAGASAPTMTCPFTGEELAVEFNKILAQYRIRGKFYVTMWYPNKDELLYDFSIRNGVLPQFPRGGVVRASVPAPTPSNPTEGLKGRAAEMDVDKIGRMLASS